MTYRFDSVANAWRPLPQFDSRLVTHPFLFLVVLAFLFFGA
jgi:hypothetical protein